LAPRLHRARHFFEHHGGAAVFVGRFVGLFRGLVPVAAGIAGMRVRRFLAWNVAASVAWTGIVITLGFLLGDSIARFLERSGAALLVVGVVAAGAVLGFRFLRRRVHGADDDIAATRAFCEFDVPKLEPGATLAGLGAESSTAVGVG
jgi:membrane protein DedA with SNARE-associated domain